MHTEWSNNKYINPNFHSHGYQFSISMATKDSSPCHYRYLCVVSVKQLNNTVQMQTEGLNLTPTGDLHFVSMVTTQFLQLCMVSMTQ